MRRLMSWFLGAALAVGLSAVSASAQIAQPTGCPAGDGGSACLGSGGGRADIVFVQNGAVVGRVASGVWSWPAGSFTLPVALGGTGAVTLTAHGIVFGEGTSAVAISSAGTSGQPMLSGGASADPNWGTLGPTFGGTGLTTATQGDLLYASGANTWASLADVAAGSLLRSGGVSTAPAYTTATFPTTVAAGNYLIATTSNAVIAVQPALTHSNPANQTGNATATLKMNGLACAITPVATGRIVFTITGQLVQTTTGDGVVVKLAEGTGTAPSNAGAAAGTIISATQTWTALTGQLTSQFAITASATGFSLATAVWFDLQIAEVTGGTASATNIDCTAHEI